ncbi:MULTISPECIES: chemotaxis protein CheW [Crocosphaera]|uniref:Purine-binding chemotaxis protein n=3 Tax=Crocosphaera watsonii TaxID=263511 RepID=T2JHI1_CROWT|nr:MULTISPECIES: CheW domain-containing protein [Crocosphaera]EHJ13225.1 CheW protein [Crocosphaera watsonii WH 0003]MCH2247624.1 CheW domain-containing protein [Crocosphaera sp.]CCQ57190.1 Purine-binding chemotaxis protein [Crocosphaera watsonii WH 0005]CCQ64730.1 Purine-binding chemotaxis protein [Crocosphaera watsonii WH 0402]
MVQPQFSQTNLATTTLNHQNPEQLEQFLRFRLAPDTTLLLPVTQLTEVITIPLGQIVPIPEMPPWVMGVYNWRGEILWIVDLGALLGLTPWHQQPQVTPIYRSIVLHGGKASQRVPKAQRQHLGAVVTGVDDIEWCNPKEIQSSFGSAISSSLAPFLRGYWLPPGQEMWVVLEPEAILSAMPQTS